MLTQGLIYCILGFASGYAVYQGAKVLDLAMDYPSPLWRIRYWLASQHAKSVQAKAILKAYRQGAMDAPIYEIDGQITAGDLLSLAYKAVADENPKFKRWICVNCMAIFFGLFVNAGATIFLLNLYGAESLLYAFFFIPGLGAAISE